MKNRLAILGTTASLLVVAACSSNTETPGTGGRGTGGGAATGGVMTGGAATGGAGTGGTMTGGAGTGGTMTGGAGMGGADGAMLPPCEVQLPVMLPPSESFACSLPKPCGEAHYVGPYSGGGAAGPMGAHFDDPAAPTCVLQKMRDREIAELTISSDPAGGIPGQFWYSETIFVLDDAHGASNWSQAMDLSFAYGTKNRQILQPASYFDACLAETDATKIYNCLIGWSNGCADVAVSCPAP